MIKKQYHRYPYSGGTCYFNNFIKMHDPDAIIENELKKYKATIAKSNQPNIKMNIKWHDEQLYMMFILRYS
jgi:hypothetical protein